MKIEKGTMTEKQERQQIQDSDKGLITEKLESQQTEKLESQQIKDSGSWVIRKDKGIVTEINLESEQTQEAVKWMQEGANIMYKLEEERISEISHGKNNNNLIIENYNNFELNVKEKACEEKVCVSEKINNYLYKKKEMRVRLININDKIKEKLCEKQKYIDKIKETEKEIEKIKANDKNKEKDLAEDVSNINNCVYKKQEKQDIIVIKNIVIKK